MNYYEPTLYKAIILLAATVFGAALISWFIAIVVEKMTHSAAEQAEEDARKTMEQANKQTRRVRAGQPWSES